ncbi:DUF3995 domain-containing protein [Terrabacter sp. LjRoot27]|uniref:DUF3995 domain-containing protein n=1 Tax=Terrabacter sp. LjRoot27 TaxID=3342306 RepID=UPI003ECD26B8
MHRASLTWFTIAAGVGTVHAAASLYWALGGDALADTVGAWAVAWRAGSPVAAGFALAAIGLVKLTAASVPWISARSGGPRGALRLLCWAGSVLLVAYGLANTAVANLALVGVVGSVDDLAATRGHAWLWDPLFLVWGLVLGVGLWQTRRRLARREVTLALTQGDVRSDQVCDQNRPGAAPLGRIDDAEPSSSSAFAGGVPL